MSKQLIKLLTECSIRKGGHNIIPIRPKPKTPPPGQKEKISKYLEFSLIEQKPKTKIVGVWAKKNGGRLGLIKWYGPWRQYAFYPEDETLFNTGCLKEIQAHIKKMMEGRRKTNGGH